MVRPFAPYTQQRPVSDRLRSIVQPIADLSVHWSEMKYFRRKTRPRNGDATHRRRLRDEPPLHAASLGSPIFVERWNGGSPLNWVEFMGSWETTRADHHPPKKTD